MNPYQATLNVLLEYMKKYSTTFEDAIAAWDEPWPYLYLTKVITLHRGVKPNPLEVCYLAGVNEKYWPSYSGGEV